VRVNPGGPIVVQCFYEQSADETYGPWINVVGAASVTFYLTSTGTTSSGVISIEEGAPKKITDPLQVPSEAVGSYSAITTVNASTFTGDAQVALHLTSVATYLFVRARISTVIGGGGSVSASCVAA